MLVRITAKSPLNTLRWNSSCFMALLCQTGTIPPQLTIRPRTRRVATGASGRMRRAFLGVFSSRGCLHTGFWAKGGRYGSRSVKNGQLLRRWGSESGLPALLCASDPAPADSGMLKTPEFARRPLGYLQAKSNRPAEICIWRSGLCKNTAAGVSAVR